jgi:hypothetical protein
MWGRPEECASPVRDKVPVKGNHEDYGILAVEVHVRLNPSPQVFTPQPHGELPWVPAASLAVRRL